MKNENQNGNQSKNAKTSESGKCCNNNRNQKPSGSRQQQPESCK